MNTKEDLGQCHQRVWGERVDSWCCQKKAVVQRNGKNYCKIHDPEYIAAKDKARQEKWSKEAEENDRKWDWREARIKAIEGLTIDELKQLNPNLCKAAPELYEALKEIKELAPRDKLRLPYALQVVEIADKAIAKVGEK